MKSFLGSHLERSEGSCLDRYKSYGGRANSTIARFAIKESTYPSLISGEDQPTLLKTNIMNTNFLESAIKQFEYYKTLGEKTFAQVPDGACFWQFNEDSNSIATIVKHLSGNMMSRWTDFLTSDGEKEWRNRESEFENDIATKEEMLNRWNAGWGVFLEALRSLSDNDLDKVVYIRNQGHTVLEAINRQLAHYPYHIGQIVFIGKMSADTWTSLSIPKGSSGSYNADRFSKPKERGHFTDEYLPRVNKDRNHEND